MLYFISGTCSSSIVNGTPPAAQATCKGPAPRRFLASMSAPRLMSRLPAATRPFSAARWRQRSP